MTDDLDTVSPGARRLGRVAVHPLLLAIYPTLALWSANATEVLPSEVWPVLWPPALGAGILWAVLTAVFHDHRRAGLVVSAIAVVVLNLGRVATEAGPGVAVVAVVAVAAVVGVATWLASRAASVVTTAIVNVLAVVLVLLTLPATLPQLAGGSAAASDVTATDGTIPTRDIWYLIPDRYPRADTLATRFGYDNSEFLGFLEERGFQIQEEALANYPKTAHSLAATWNFELIEDLVTGDPAGDDWQPIYALLRDHRLGRLLTEAGYHYTHLGTWWSPTATAASADDVRRLDTQSEFGAVWRAQTALAAFDPLEDGTADWDYRQRNREYTTWQLDELDRLARLNPGDEPRFVLAHITLPHEPYVFAADGSLLTAQEASSRTYPQNLTGQVAYVNSRIEQLVETLLAGPDATDPIIVIQSDEGPTPLARVAAGPSFDWTTATDAQLREKLRTLSAIHAPGVDLPEDLTGVNTWRILLDAYLGTDLGTVDDPVQVFTDEQHLYDLHEVTERVR